MIRQKITPHLWFDDQAEDAARFYVSIFPDSRIGAISRYGKTGAEVAGRHEGSVMTVAFELVRQSFLALNGGPQFPFSPAISLVVSCDTQREVDEYWEKLSDGGEPGRCGWLQDRYGVSWQIVPAILGELMTDPPRSEAVMGALLEMGKLDIRRLREAHDAV